MEHTENKMGVMNVNRLLITMALPMMASMLIQALYNIVDSIFVAQYSKDALTAGFALLPGTVADDFARRRYGSRYQFTPVTEIG